MIGSVDLPQSGNDCITKPNQLAKVDRQEEWARLPLSSKEQLITWFRDKQRADEHVANRSRDPLSQNSRSEAPDMNVGAGDRVPRAMPGLSDPPASATLEQRSDSENFVSQLHRLRAPNAPNIDGGKALDQWSNYF